MPERPPKGGGGSPPPTPQGVAIVMRIAGAIYAATMVLILAAVWLNCRPLDATLLTVAAAVMAWVIFWPNPKDET